MDEKLFFNPGDTVVIRQLKHGPTMVVRSVDKIENAEGGTKLIGIWCYWFTNTLELRDARFNTKDLIHVTE